MKKFTLSVLLFFILSNVYAQLVEVRADYNGIGDCDFTAHNNSKTPVFLNIDFADLENASFNEPLPYIKMLTPGFNNLFTLERDLDADVPRFNYQIKSFRSNPMAQVDLDYPYLIPFKPDLKVKAFDVENIDGFFGAKEFKSWSATGFYAKSGESVHSSRRGTVVEIAGNQRSGDTYTWYNAWTNSITLLQPDGTLICYKNVVDKEKQLKLNQTIHAGQKIGEVAPNTTGIVMLIYKNSLTSDDLVFIIPQFIVKENKLEIVNSATEYKVVHPDSVRGMEMSKREKRKLIGRNN